MHKLYTFFIFAFSCCFLTVASGQEDTVRVQTFTWDSNTRAEVFQFPDNPDQTYRKIWMKYNMRCHDAAVGNGSVGCREWDYSCNTFITDPSRTDSTRQTHPTHIISNFSDDVFEYTTQPTWSYIDYAQVQTQLTIDNAVGNAIGNGGEELIFPALHPVTRAQFLYTANELANAGLSAGEIHALDLQNTQEGQIDFLRIRLKPTTSNELDPDAPELYGFSEVYFSNTILQPSGIQRIPFYQPFEWDGMSNLIVEFSFSQVTNGTTPGVVGSESGFNSSLVSTVPNFSLYFSGAGAISVPSEKFSTLSNEITISLWANGIPDIMPANSTVFEGKDANNNRQINVHLPWGNGQVYWDCGNDGGGYDRINKQANPEDFEGRWNHWAFTKNATSGDMKIFLNGQLWHSGTGLTKSILTMDAFEIASAVTGGSAYYGSVDEFRVWNKALEETEIREWMHRSVTPDHPNYDNLVAYFPIEEGSGSVVADAANNGEDATVIQPGLWAYTRGKDLVKNFSGSSLRPDATFIQGDATLINDTLFVRDSFPNAPNSVTYYGVDGTDLVVTDNQLLYEAGYSYVRTETGEVTDSVFFAPENSIDIGTLTYYAKADAKYEILSLVTPYGNGLDLGDDGKTFYFDVTDYAPILKGEKRISIEMGGQWQEELDIEFIYITGTPPREVIDIQHIWPFRRGWFADIQSDRFFEPRDVALSPDGHHFKLRSAITGHGQNGEFVPRNHYLNVNGGSQDFTYDVWKECADNPIYPQGGTWIFDRAGWCPGAATDVHEFDITDLVTPGGSVEIDYGVNGTFMDQANYLVANQLVTYGPYAHTIDASLERIARPNSTDVEFERINPACSSPLLWVKNTGSAIITSLLIEYYVHGNTDDVQTYNWGGTIEPGEQATVELPVNSVSFWETTYDEHLFEARIVTVNGIQDGELMNNKATSFFEPAHYLDPNWEYLLETRTNNVGSDNSYKIFNTQGDVVMERDVMLSNTTYEDEFDFPPGCYTLEFLDEGNDGLEFWFFPGNGNGRVTIDKIVNVFLIPEVTFDSDFGSIVQYDFVVDELVSADEEKQFRALSTYPNPSAEDFTVELRGFEGEEVTLQLTDLQGRTLRSFNPGSIFSSFWTHTLNLGDLPAGMYVLKVTGQEKVWVRQVVKQ